MPRHSDDSTDTDCHCSTCRRKEHRHCKKVHPPKEYCSACDKKISPSYRKKYCGCEEKQREPESKCIEKSCKDGKCVIININSFEMSKECDTK